MTAIILFKDCFEKRLKYTINTFTERLSVIVHIRFIWQLYLMFSFGKEEKHRDTAH